MMPPVIRAMTCLMCFVAATQLSCGAQQTPVAPSASVTIQSISVTLATIDGEYQGAAIAALSDGSTKDVTDAASWVSSNTAVATVSSAGRVTIVNNGDTDIRATYQASAGFVHLVVTNRPTSTPAPSPSPTPVPLYRLTGILRDGLDQRPIEGATVSASGKTATVISVDNGLYSLNLPAGTHTVSVTSVGYVPESRVVTVPQETVLDFTLTPIAGTLRINSLIWISGDPNVRVPCEGRVEIVDGPDAGRFAVIPPGGTGVIENVQPGRFRVRASATNYEPDEKEHRFRANGPNNYMNFLMCPVGSSTGPVCIRQQPPCS